MTLRVLFTISSILAGEIMSAVNSPDQGLYLYAVIEGDGSHATGIAGISGGDVYTISHGDLTAVVSDVPNKKMRPERRHLAAHQNVLKALMADSTPLPMAFGIIANDPGAVQAILSENQDMFEDQFMRVRGKVEMGLRVAWDVPNIFDYFIDKHPDLRTARDNYFGTHRQPTHEDKIALGRLFDRILSEDREDYTQAVEDILSLYCDDIKRNRCRAEKDVMNLACLVARKNEARFEAGVIKAANLFDNNFAFDYNGPWAPHNFVDLSIQF
ncbi:MAG: GvpL/GvpF family gas vesicle protein [Desulfobacterales bacterium]|nr:GvpL/GvpF family gas vesicle protein [Desulfobacterales bacterium]